LTAGTQHIEATAHLRHTSNFDKQRQRVKQVMAKARLNPG